MVHLTRRTVLAAASASLAMPGILRAQSDFPNQPIRLIVPWPPGGSTDIAMRAIGDVVARVLGKPVVTDNKPGAGGSMGATYLTTQARPDGYTLSQIPMSALRMPYMNNSATYNPLTDFTWISQLTGYTFGVAVRADSPFKTFQELLDWAKEHPGELIYGTSGVGTSIHLTMERIAADRGLELLHVPFRGVAEDMVALLSGSIMCSADSSAWAPMVLDGKMRLLCVWTPERIAQFPDVPTLRECGIDLVVTSPFGVAGPKGMDPAVVAKLDGAFATAIRDPMIIDVLKRIDQFPDYLNSADYTVATRNAIETELPLLRRLNLLVRQ